MENIITFPGLGLNLSVSQIAFTIFGIEIHWYAVFIAIGVLLAFLLCIYNSKKLKIEFDHILNIVILALPVGFICARLYYVLFNMNYFIQNTSKIFNIRDGGMAIYGGILGGLLVIYIYCKRKKINLLDMTDIIAPGLAIAQSIGRWGNFVNVEAYGEVTGVAWRMGITTNGTYSEVHPAFLYESICTFLIFIITMFLINKRKFNGQVTYIYIMLYSFIRIFIEGIRIDSLMLYNIRISQILSVLLFVVSCSILIYKIRQNRKNSN